MMNRPNAKRSVAISVETCLLLWVSLLLVWSYILLPTAKAPKPSTFLSLHPRGPVGIDRNLEAAGLWCVTWAWWVCLIIGRTYFWFIRWAQLKNFEARKRLTMPGSNWESLRDWREGLLVYFKPCTLVLMTGNFYSQITNTSKAWLLNILSVDSFTISKETIFLFYRRTVEMIPFPQFQHNFFVISFSEDEALRVDWLIFYRKLIN